MVAAGPPVPPRVASEEFRRTLTVVDFIRLAGGMGLVLSQRPACAGSKTIYWITASGTLFQLQFTNHPGEVRYYGRPQVSHLRSVGGRFLRDSQRVYHPVEAESKRSGDCERSCHRSRV